MEETFGGYPDGEGFSQVQADLNGDEFADYLYVVAKVNIDYFPSVSSVNILVADFSASIASGNAPPESEVY